MFIKAHYWLVGEDIWMESNETDVMLCHRPDGRTNIFPPDDPYRKERLVQMKELGIHVAYLILPYTVLTATRESNQINFMKALFKDACILVPLQGEAEPALPLDVRVIQQTKKSQQVLASYLDDNGLLHFDEDVYTHLKMSL